MPIQERLLVWLFRIGGVVTLSALAFVFVPFERMAAIHAALGLETLPHTPVVEYMARSLSALYALHGTVLLLASTDVRRLRPLAVLIGWQDLALGLMLIGIDLVSGLPAWWFWNEGPFLVVIGPVVLWLVRSVPRTG